MRAAIPVRMNSLTETAAQLMGTAVAAMRDIGRQATAVVARGIERVRQLANLDAQAPADPLLDEGGPRLPGTGSRAFWIGSVVVGLSLVSGLATYLILTGLTPIVPRNEIVLGVLFVNLLLVIAMVAVIAVQAIGLWRAWRNKVAGARLHVRIVLLFSLITALPALLLAVAATTTFSRSLDNWFNRQTTDIVMNSLDVAHAYLEEHGQVIRTDIVNMGKDLDDAATEVASDPRKFRELMFAQAGLRDLPVAYVVDCQGQREGGGAGGRAHSLHRAARAPDPRRRGRPRAAADAGQHLPRRGHRQAAQLSGLLSLRRPRRQPEGRHAPAQHRARRHRVRAAARASRRPQVRARPDVLHDLADRAAGSRVGRAVVRRPAAWRRSGA